MEKSPHKETEGGGGCKDRLERLSAAVHTGTEKLFEKVSTVVVNHPGVTIAICVVFAAAMAQGIWFYDEEVSSDKLFTPQDSQAFNDETWVIDRFGNDARTVFLQTLGTEGTNMLTKASLLYMQEMHEWFLSQSLIVDGEDVTYNVVCSRYSEGDGCKAPVSVLSFWQHNRTLLEADADPLATVNSVNWRDIEPSGPPLSYYIGSDAVYSGAALLVSTRATRIIYDLKNEKEEISGVGEDDPQSRYFEILVAEKSADRRSADRQAHSAETYILTEGEEAEAGIEAGQDDIASLFIGYFLMLFYASFVLSRGRVKYSHSILGLVSVVSIGLSTFSAYGLCWYIGIKFNTVVQVLVLVLLGVGIDDTFVIMDSWWDCSEIPTMKERMIAAMKHAGPAITITSVTDLIAFLAGSGTAFPALRDFCYYATIGITFDFVFQCTFVVAIAYFDSVRQESSRSDCLCCVPVDDETGVCVKKDGSWTEGEKGIQNRIVGTHMPRLVLGTLVGKVVVILISCLLFGLGIYGCTKVKMNFNQEWFIPDGDAIEDAMDVRDTYFNGQSLPANVYFSDINYPQEQDTVLNAGSVLRKNIWVTQNSTSSWMEDFQQWVKKEHVADWDQSAGRIVPSQFYRLLRVFASTATGPRSAWQHIDNIRWSSNGSDSLVASRVGFLIVGQAAGDGQDAIDCMDNLRAELSGSEFPWAFMFLFWESYKLMVPEITQNVAIAGSCVFVLVSLMIANIQLGLLVALIIGFVDVCMIGFMPFIGVELNGVSVICIVLAVGLSVDYSVHIAGAFLHVKCEDGDEHSGRTQRAAFALWKMGPAVVNGGTSTFIAILPAAFAVSYVFKVFFRMFALIIFFGQWFGVFLLPVVLSFVGPDAYLTAPELKPRENPLHPEHDDPVATTTKGTTPVDVEMAEVSEAHP
eukprot:TRINITY_DN96_c0_g1_i8.p1 TRINITY_DN96_c0_g1~~TRINITY_DN96_c0_g1_i8.p1  ORF type:complete len:918 (+),score=275.72 TRINITY_DN96_c0_g1_i8:89-2842(+)